MNYSLPYMPEEKSFSSYFYPAFVATVIVHVILLSISLLEKRQQFYFGAQTKSLAIQLKTVAKVQPMVKRKAKPKKQVAKKPAPIPQEAAPVEEVAEQEAPAVKHTFESAIKSFTQPSYPRIAKRRGITGEVILALWIKGDGMIKRLLVEQSSGNDSLDRSALKAARDWKFKQISSNVSDVIKIQKKIVYVLN